MSLNRNNSQLLNELLSKNKVLSKKAALMLGPIKTRLFTSHDGMRAALLLRRRFANMSKRQIVEWGAR